MTVTLCRSLFPPLGKDLPIAVGGNHWSFFSALGTSTFGYWLLPSLLQAEQKQFRVSGHVSLFCQMAVE